MRILASLHTLLTALATCVQAQWDPPDTLLTGITARGRFLAEYDQAAWHATDAVMSFKPEPQAAGLMLAVRRADGRWEVLFGWLTTASDTFYVTYHAEPTNRSDSFVVQVNTPPKPLVGAERLAATALRTSLSAFGNPGRPYNVYAFPRADGSFFIYLLPAQTDFSVFPHGADVRYLVAPDGRQILDKHQMHNALLNLALPDSAVSGVHTVITDDFPQDSDVFLVLARSPRRPELIATAHHNYEVHVDGSISWRRADR